MDERTAFITGGSGFIGGRLLGRLVSEGWSVRALARSDASARRVEDLGATPVRGGLDDLEALGSGAEGCAVGFHLAAKIGDFEPASEFFAANVNGTANVLRACREAGVRRFVNVSSYTVVLADGPVTGVDERAPLRFDSPVPYNVSKALAETVVRTASDSGFETITIRPSFTWGEGDRHLLPEILELVEADRFAWLDGGRHRVATSHVDNVVEALILASERGLPGSSYFVSDDETWMLREFLSAQLRAEGASIPWLSVPTAVVLPLARAVERVWGILRPGRRPPLTVAGCVLVGRECTVDDARARAELGYAPVRSAEQGLDEIRQAQGGGQAGSDPATDGDPRLAAAAGPGA